MPTRPLAYVIESRQVGGNWRGFIIAKCSGCDNNTEVQWNSHNNPNHVAKYFKRLGWDFDPYRVKGNKCRSCNKPVLLTHSTEPDLSTFGKRLKWTREQIHLGRDQLADESRIPRLILQHIELGTTGEQYHLEDAAAVRLADVLVEHGAIVDANWLSGLTDRTNALAVNLRRQMHINHLTEGSLATESHVPPSQIKMMLSGALETHYQIDAIAKALHVKPEELTGKLDKPKPVVVPHGSNLPAIGLAKVFFGDTPGNKLRQIRKDRNLTQGHLAEMIYGQPGTEAWSNIGSIQAMISAAERGKSTQSTARLLSIAAACLDIPELAPTEHLPAKQIPTALPVVVSEALQNTLVNAESDLTELRLMQKKLLDEAEALGQMIGETAQKVEQIRQQLTTPRPETKHLKFVRGMWHFRRKVPADAREIFGLAEFDANLRTPDIEEALRRKPAFERAFDNKLNEVRGE
jgi:transcriptional regulator with XRE-family HTH domain